MDTHQKPSLKNYIDDLQSKGRLSFTASEAKSQLGLNNSTFLAATERQQSKSKLLKPKQGFYVTILPKYKIWGGPSPHLYIDALMKHENEPYYVAILQAAQIHGASHQAVMEYQVITEKRMPRIEVGPNRIVFYNRKSIESVAEAIEERQK